MKTSDEGVDKEYDLESLPALAFYRHKFRTIYTGDLMKEEEILEWVLELYESSPDVIESVDRKTLQVLINDVEHLAVFFCKWSPHTGHCSLIMTFNSVATIEQMTTSVPRARAFWRSWKPSTTRPMSMAFSLSSPTM